MKNKFTLSIFPPVVYVFIISLLSLLSLAMHSYAGQMHMGKDILLKGDFIQGGLVIGRVPPGSQVVFEQKSIRVSPQGDFIIGFNRDEPQQVSLKIITPDKQTIAKQLLIKKRVYKIQRINGLPKAKVSPRKPEVLARIRKEIVQAASARKLDDERSDFLQDFIWPTRGRISGVYGSQRVLNGKPRRPHFGVDVAAPTGTAVLAPASGIITLANPDMFFSGGTIILDHGHGLSSSFLHLSQLLVKTGDVVKQGDLIARVGATGRVTGAHLDWRMNLFKRRVDPQLLVPDMASQLKSNSMQETKY